MFFVILLLILIPSYFAWTAIHELSHLAMFRSFRKLVGVDIKLYPHKDKLGYFVWSSVYAVPLGAPITANEDAAIKLAPRIPGFIALILFAISGVITNSILLPIWLGFWGCGVFDFIYGSIGVTSESDLQSASRDLSISPWILRCSGIGLGLASIISMLVWVL